MGYTHYWEAGSAESDQATAVRERYVRIGIPALRQVFARHAGILARSYHEPDLPPLADCNKISFNGMGDNSCEDFYLPIHDYAFSGCHAFCKTGREPYDLAVCETLLILAYCNPRFEIRSDGFDGKHRWPKNAARPKAFDWLDGADESWPEALREVAGLFDLPVRSGSLACI